MNSMGCSFLLLTLAALVASLVPILSWTVYAVALPLAIVGVVQAVRSSRQPTAQDADRAMLWLSLGLLGLTFFRMVAL